MNKDLLAQLIPLLVERDDLNGHVIVDQERNIIWSTPTASSLLRAEAQTKADPDDVFNHIAGMNAAINAALTHGIDTRLQANIPGQQLAIQIKSIPLDSQCYCHIQIYQKASEYAATASDIALLKEQYLQVLDVASQLFSDRTSNNTLAGLTLWQHKRESFAGDTILAAKRPAGGVNVFLGNFVGGLIPAAMGAFSLAEVFYGMTGKGYGLSDIIAEINRKLQKILPEKMFCVAAAVEIDPTAKILAVWNGGLPDLLVIGQDAKIKHRVHSRHIPLGLHKMKSSDLQLQFLEAADGDHAYIMTSGLLNACNTDKQSLSMEEFASLLMRQDSPQGVIDALENFITEAEQSEDMSLLALNVHQLAETNFDTDSVVSQSGSASNWEVKFELSAEILRQLDLVPLLINVISHLHTPQAHRQRIYTVLAELCTNAIDHGILQLDSALKQTPKGFAEYYMLRAERLSHLEVGHIKVGLSHKPFENGGLLSIKVEDSGEGFDSSQLSWDLTQQSQMSGRGLALVKRLCRNLHFNSNGNQVQTEYYWENTPA